MGDYQYDARNRQTQKTLPASLGGGYFAYGYDAASNLSAFTDAVTVPGQAPATSYHYNSADELDYLQEPAGAQTTFLYDANHRRTSTGRPTSPSTPPACPWQSAAPAARPTTSSTGWATRSC